ncbi:MAG: hypothetical protein ACXADO_05630 [Candidatus Thorarchaeota archaeon]|jgi:hypothetical protein
MNEENTVESGISLQSLVTQEHVCPFCDHQKTNQGRLVLLLLWAVPFMMLLLFFFAVF